MKLTVVIPAYNHLDRVMTCINSLRALALDPFEIVVQDDASTAYYGPAVIPPEVARCGRNAVNLGFGGNCNAGAAATTGDVLMFVNQDVFGVDGWSNGWDRAILAGFDAADVGIVGARLLFRDGRVQNAGGAFDGRQQPYHVALGWRDPQHPDVATARDVGWTTGAALAVRREVFEALGGFDTAYRMYFEDVDLCLRARDAGWRTWYAPDCTLIHEGGITGGSPYFADSARVFYARWVATQRVKADTTAIKERYW